MPIAQTEQLHDHAIGLDQRPSIEAAELLIGNQCAAAAVVHRCASDIAIGAKIMAQTIKKGGVLHYVAAGSSALMAAADAQELGGTFSIPASQVRIHMSGGLPKGVEMPGDSEDLSEGLDIGLSSLTPDDAVIAVSASGTTPYVLSAAEIARKAGAQVIGIANNAGSALLETAHVAITLATPPELLSGSTRMGAGTAQKIALNTLSTAMAIRLGHVHDGMMINMRADNTKLHNRAVRIVSRIANVDAPTARKTLDATKGEVKPAALMAAQSISKEDAKERLNATNGNLRAALARTIKPMSQLGDER